MLGMVLKRLMLAIPSLIGVVIVTFLLTRALPGDPAAYFAGRTTRVKDAVQPGRRITTVHHQEFGMSVRTAMLSAPILST